jgi:hypothetical protein
VLRIENHRHLFESEKVVRSPTVLDGREGPGADRESLTDLGISATEREQPRWRDGSVEPRLHFDRKRLSILDEDEIDLFLFLGPPEASPFTSLKRYVDK